MVSVSVVCDRMITGLAHGYTEFDWSVLGLIAAEAAGIENQTDTEWAQGCARRPRGLDVGEMTMTANINVEQATIAGTSLAVSRVGLGTWAIGGWMWGGTDDTESVRQFMPRSSAAST